MSNVGRLLVLVGAGSFIVGLAIAAVLTAVLLVLG